jgi:hypothetical protein
MAPHRLTRRGRLKETDLPGWRWWIIRHTPTILIDYLFEVLLAAAAAITSVAYFAGISAETSVIRVLPDWLAGLYGITMTVAAAVVILGLATRHYGTTLAYGLRVLAIGCIVYALSAASYVGTRAVVPISMSFVLGILAAWRGFLLHSTYLKVAAELRGEKGGAGAET